jgi:hypothetical protein
MLMLTRRLQILLDEPRHRRLVAEAERLGTSVATVVRMALDARLGRDGEQRRMWAISTILAAPPMPVPDDPAELKREIDSSRTAPSE